MRSIVTVIRSHAEGRDEERPTLRVAPGSEGCGEVVRALASRSLSSSWKV
jgi:hypothetical protein